jgi:hypothetical protein
MVWLVAVWLFIYWDTFRTFRRLTTSARIIPANDATTALASQIWNNRVRRWSFGCFTKDKVTVYGSKGKMNFLFLRSTHNTSMKRNNETLYRTYQEPF